MPLPGVVVGAYHFGRRAVCATLVQATGVGSAHRPPSHTPRSRAAQGEKPH